LRSSDGPMQVTLLRITERVGLMWYFSLQCWGHLACWSWVCWRWRLDWSIAQGAPIFFNIDFHDFSMTKNENPW